MGDRNARMIAEAIALLAANEFDVDAWTVLSSSNRLILELKPSGLIAKIVRVGDYARLARELAVASHVVACAGPAAAPAFEHQPYRGSSVAVSLWSPLVLLGQPSDAVTCGAYLDLRHCLESFREALPDFRRQSPMHDAWLRIRWFNPYQIATPLCCVPASSRASCRFPDVAGAIGFFTATPTPATSRLHV